MRHMCVFLLLVLGLSSCLAQSLGRYCYKRKCSYQCSGWFWNNRCSRKCEAVKQCCDGYCGTNCACTHQCTRIQYYQGICCRDPNCDYTRKACLEKRSVSCDPCTKARQVTVCCSASSSGSRKCPS